MSYILAALNKAERDRKANDKTGIMPIHQSMGDSKRQWVLVFIVSMAGSALVLALYLALQNINASPEQRNISLQSAVPAAPSVKEKELEYKPIVKELAQESKSSPVSEQTPVNKTAEDIIADNSSVAGKVVKGPSLRAMIAGANQAPSSVEQQPRVAGSVVFLQDDGVPVVNEIESLSEDDRATEINQPADIPMLHSLPDAVRESLPVLELNIHVFSSAPSKRFVYINSQRYSEGEQIEGGVMVEEITPNGVVLQHQGVFFRLVLDT